jgi:hypothetical protein
MTYFKTGRKNYPGLCDTDLRTAGRKSRKAIDSMVAGEDTGHGKLFISSQPFEVLIQNFPPLRMKKGKNYTNNC